MITWKKHKAILLPSYNGGLIGYNPSRLGENKLYYYNHGVVHSDAYHLYILSDEGLKTEDWVYDEGRTHKVFKINKFSTDAWHKRYAGEYIWRKIIASTDKSLSMAGIPESFLKEFCERGGMDEVMVGYLESGHLAGEFNEISIRLVKETWTRDDMESLIDFTRGLAYMDGTKAQHEFSASDILDKWIEQNL